MPLTILARTPQEAARKTLNGILNAIMTEIGYDKLALAECVAGGPFDFRVQCSRKLSAFIPAGSNTDDLANRLFGFFEERAIVEFGSVAGAKAFLDNLERIEGPPTEQEINDAWVLESASSERAKRQIYGDLSPQEWLKRSLQ